jgi:hypothetical protein
MAIAKLTRDQKLANSIFLSDSQDLNKIISYLTSVSGQVDDQNAQWISNKADLLQTVSYLVTDLQQLQLAYSDNNLNNNLDKTVF